jgi:hypothetical protein
MPPIGLPLLHEEEVDGVVASVFVDIRARMPFVPALFKALAADPQALVAAWLQARTIYNDQRSQVAADQIRSSAHVRIGFRPSRRVSETVAPFAAELPYMLLIVDLAAAHAERRATPAASTRAESPGNGAGTRA